MEHDKIILELLNRVMTLEEKVANLEKSKVYENANEESPSGSKKYRFLSDFLYKSNEPRIKLSFGEIEDILGFNLPDSASTHRAFWANTTSHSIALSWLSVNYEVAEANIENKYIVFEKKREFEKMKINEQLKTIVSEIISEYGPNYKISLKEIYELLSARFGTNTNSIIPSDYCYNRTNKGIEFLKRPHFFQFLGDGMYKCLGENFLYDGPVVAAEKGQTNETEVGYWKNGIFHKNDNWDILNLK